MEECLIRLGTGCFETLWIFQGLHKEISIIRKFNNEIRQYLLLSSIHNFHRNMHLSKKKSILKVS